LAENQVGNDFFGLVRFVYGKGVGGDAVNFEPGVGDANPFEVFVFGVGEELAPVGGLRGEKRRK
jgi:hypothetical protein